MTIVLGAALTFSAICNGSAPRITAPPRLWVPELHLQPHLSKLHILPIRPQARSPQDELRITSQIHETNTHETNKHRRLQPPKPLLPQPLRILNNGPPTTTILLLYHHSPLNITNHLPINQLPPSPLQHPPPPPQSNPHPAPSPTPFTITTLKAPILKSTPIDLLQSRLGIPIPEMIFGDNHLTLHHTPTAYTLTFTPEPALDLVDKTGSTGLLKVHYATAWSATREKTSAGIKEVVKPFDWSYTTSYRGTETPGLGGQKLQRDDKARIPVELLQRRDPILFADEVVLYESELDDNGVSVLTVKVRVMEQRMLVLCRFFLRLDNVLVRVRDTRVYVDFGEERVVREYTAREGEFGEVKKKLYMEGLMPDQITIAFRDANQIAHLLPVVEHEVESVCLEGETGQTQEGR
ncbi:Tap42 interacting protein [Podospora pseudoanserina]|nr:Tap42 interacting protein [Podospora pseudoanserina]